MKDFLPSYNLHGYLNRSLNEMIDDSVHTSPPTYVDSIQSINSRTSSITGDESLNTDSIPPPIYTTTSPPTSSNNSIHQTASEFYSSGAQSLHSITSNSLYSSLNSLPHMRQSVVIVNIVLYDYSLLRYNPYYSNDTVSGVVRVSNTTDKPIEYEAIYITLEGLFQSKRNDSSRKVTSATFLDMIDFKASGLASDLDTETTNKKQPPPFPMTRMMDPLPGNQILQPFSNYDTPFQFQFPTITKTGFQLPLSIGDYYTTQLTNVEMKEAVPRYYPKEDFTRNKSFSVSYSVHARLLEFNKDKTGVVIREHVRHVVDFGGVRPEHKFDDGWSKGKVGMFSNRGDGKLFELCPEVQLKMLVKHLEATLKSIGSTNGNTGYEDPGGGVGSSSGVGRCKAPSSVINQYNTCDESSLVVRPNRGNCIMLSPQTSKKPIANSSICVNMDLSTSITGKLLASPTLLTPVQDSDQLIIQFDNRLIKTKYVKMHAVTVFSTYQIPVKLSPSWFINENQFEGVIRPRFNKIQNTLNGLNKNNDECNISIDLQDYNLILGSSNIEVLDTELCSKSYNVKSITKKSDIVSKFKLQMTGKVLGSTILLPSFQSCYVMRFYYLKFGIKLPDGLTSEDGQKIVEWDVPVELL